MNNGTRGKGDGRLGQGLRLARLRAALLALAMTFLATTACARGDAGRATDSTRGLTATITVEPFRSVAPAPKMWVPEVFAESLATRLALVQGLRVTHGALGPSTDYALRGDVSARDGRLVMATRLWRTGEPSAVWTATFWRGDGPNRNLVEDIATGVAEALYADITHRALTTKEKR